MYLGYELKRISKELDRYLDSILFNYNITASQARVLRYLIDHQGEAVTQKDICKAWDLKHTTVIGLLNRLKEKELIFIMPDTENKRCNNVMLTDKGKQLSTIISENLNHSDQKLTEGLTSAELDNLLTAVEVLRKNVEKL